MRKGLFTYTTKIEPQKTIAEIQEILVAHGARAVMTDYTAEGKIETTIQNQSTEGEVMKIKEVEEVK